MLNDAGNVSHSHFSKRVSAMAAVVENQPVLGVDGIEEIRTETNGDPNHSRQVARRRTIDDVLRLQLHRSKKTHVVGARDKDKPVARSARPLHLGLRMIVQESGSENLLFSRCSSQLPF